MALTDKKTKEEKADKKPAKATKKPVAKKTAPAKEADASMKELYSGGTAKKAASGKKTEAKRSYAQAYMVLERPLVTEKAANLGSLNKYAFVVSKDTNKVEVAKAVETVYGVGVKDVNIVRMMGKKVSRGRIRGQRKDWKKAIVTLKKGDSIQIYEGV